MYSGKKHDLQVLTYLKDTERDLIAVYLEVPGSLDVSKAVFDSLARNGARVINSQSVAGPGSPTTRWTFFAEVKKNFDIRKARTDCIRSGAVEFRALKSVSGLVWDAFHFPVHFSDGRRGIAISLDSFGGLIRRLHEILGTGASTILYQMGEAIGNAAARGVTSNIPKASVKATLQVTSDMYALAGWGRIVALRRGKDSILVRVRSNFECASLNTSPPRSHFFRGELCGSLGAAFGRTFVCEETRCLGDGGDICEFTLHEP